MEFRLLPADVSEWIEARQSPPRSDGHHVSTLCLGMLKAIAPEKYAEWGRDDDPRKSIYEMGWIWEDLMREMLVDKVVEHDCHVLDAQHEIERDGIFGTPDRLLLHIESGDLIVQETKVTWKRYKDAIDDPKFTYWVMQVKTYCAMLGATRARIRALFINELYSGKFVIPACWELRWQPHELDEWWQSVSNFARTLES